MYSIVFRKKFDSLEFNLQEKVGMTTIRSRLNPMLEFCGTLVLNKVLHLSFSYSSHANIFFGDKGDLTHECAIVSLYNHPGFDTNFHLLDYAFCKISNRNVQAPPNIPFQTQTIITSIKDTVSNSTELFEVQKVGRTTGHTHGKVMDVLVRFFSDLSDHSPVTALAVYGQGFGKLEIIQSCVVKFIHIQLLHTGDGGDSGSPVFDIDGQLWGIYQGNMIGLPISMVIPIHIIINDAFVRFDVAFRLL
ncbi:hypothetical protein C1645_471501 [Glomus cerebriforme]|uniref:Peptidase S1 domain-containing protein n=1 Tax=Glomus cerebriforme TaxID=658196 RepID=A0A397TBF8_9GLOM|nr:hypothetical protein C1645_471501 [Glomus cerebriforme]